MSVERFSGGVYCNTCGFTWKVTPYLSVYRDTLRIRHDLEYCPMCELDRLRELIAGEDSHCEKCRGIIIRKKASTEKGEGE